MAEQRWKQALGNFDTALIRLWQAVNKIDHSGVERDGTVRRFGIAFKLAISALDGLFTEQGANGADGPKNILKLAFQNRLIMNGDLWMQMFTDFERSQHFYGDDVGLKIFESVRDEYATALADLGRALKDA